MVAYAAKNVEESDGELYSTPPIQTTRFDCWYVPSACEYHAAALFDSTDSKQNASIFEKKDTERIHCVCVPLDGKYARERIGEVGHDAMTQRRSSPFDANSYAFEFDERLAGSDSAVAEHSSHSHRAQIDRNSAYEWVSLAFF